MKQKGKYLECNALIATIAISLQGKLHLFCWIKIKEVKAILKQDDKVFDAVKVDGNLYTTATTLVIGYIKT